MNSTDTPTGRTIYPFSRELYIMAKPVGASCNLKCEYCYYLEKSGEKGLYPHTGQMDDKLLERYVREYIQSQTTPEVLFIWHGGEPMLRGLDFYRRALEYQRIYAGGRRVYNSLQTNGTLIDEKWSRFFSENGFLLGVSIDGPASVHDHFRRSRSNEPTFHRVLKGIELLNRYGVEWNALSTVNSQNVISPVETYDFFKQMGCHYVQFTPVVEFLDRGTGRVTDFSVSARQWGDFLCSIFDRWWQNDVGVQFIQLFDATLANWMGMPPAVCTMARECGCAGVIEYNGDVYSCDHFVFPEYRLGNIYLKSLSEMMYSPRQIQFGQSKYTTLARECRECRYLFLCNGECPKNRINGLNYLCEGYKRFFEHSAPAMIKMKDAISRGK